MKFLSAAIVFLATLLMTALLGLRFYLMLFFPGTPETRWLFDRVIPHWDQFSHVTSWLQVPLKMLCDKLLPYAPADISAWYPEVSTSVAIQTVERLLNPHPLPIDYQKLYPGTIEWLTLLAIPFWLVLPGLFHMSFWAMVDNRAAVFGKLSKPLQKRRPPKAPPAPAPMPARQAEHSAEPETQPQQEKDSKFKARLSQFKPTSGSLPQVQRQDVPTGPISAEAMELHKKQQGDMMVRGMIRELQKENQQLHVQQQQLRSTFSQYFSPNVLQYLEENKTTFQQVENQKRMVSILFCDIRGFSTYSQSASSEDVVNFLGEYFNIASYAILQKHDGVISKLMGDGLMAYWGFPIPQADHAYTATRAALEILKEVDLRNRTGNHAQKLQVGIGIATGEALVGNIGSTDFKDFTLVGVPVNLASRLDEANKQLNTSLLICESTYAALKGRIACRDCGDVQLRGWQGAERLYAPQVEYIQT